MSKREKNTKNKFKRKLNSHFENLKFKSINFSFSKQIIILWSIIWFISLFLPWIIDNNKTWNSFNSLTWNIWFIIVIILVLSIFVTISNNYKEKIKLYSDLSIKNHFIIITSWLFILSFSIISLSFISWLNTFSWDMRYWNWIILCMTSSIIILIWWFLTRKEYYSNSSEIILDKLNNDRKKIKEKNNMKLPF